MKTKILFPVIIFCLLYSWQVQAQEFSYQFFGGGNISYQSVNYDFGIKGIDTSYTTDPRFTANLGFGIKFDIKNFGIKLEAQYLKKSGKITTGRVGEVPGFTAVQREYINSNDYIQLALLPQLNLPVITKSHIYINAGPYYSFTLAANETVYETTLLQNRSYSKDISGSIRSYDAGLIFGTGLEYTEAPYIGFTVGFRYSMGLQNILNIPDKDKISMKNNSFNFGVGIILK
ncbi:MAG: PorT family protein [Ignavibacteriae bacterium]|nr:PorT family protein [Ignavibacteriota bacterium]